MANADHLARIKEGVTAWNLWRKGHPEVVPDLSQADLANQILTGVDLVGAELFQTALDESNLDDADLSESKLEWANLTGAYLRKTVLKQANLTMARVGWTVFADLDFRSATGLEAVRHESPSTIGIDTIHRSNGEIPEVFLRGCGLPEPFIV